MSRKPWFPFWVDDFWQDEAVQAMSYEEVGLYLRLLSLQWREGSIPSDLEKLCRICTLDAQALAKLWPSISPCFTNPENEPGRLVNPRLAEIDKQQTDVHRKLSERGKAGAHGRWGGHSPSNAKAMPKNGKSESESDITAKDLPPSSPPLGHKQKTTANDKTDQPTASNIAANGSKSNTRPTKRKSPTTPPPDNFEPTEGDIEWFGKKYGEVQKSLVIDQTEQFLNRHKSLGNQFVDWSAAWKTWMHNWQTDFGKKTPNGAQMKKPSRPNPNLVTLDERN